MKFFTKSSIRSPQVRLGNKGKYILLFLNGFLLALLCYFYIEDNYEKQLFTALAGHVQTEVSKEALPAGIAKDSILVKSLHLVNQLESSRAAVFSDFNVNGMKAQVIQPVTYDLMTGKQACGGFSYVLGRLLNELNVDVRFAQMKVKGLYGGHILIEAKTSRGWIVLDPSFNIAFKKPDGQLASFTDVQSNWNYYKAQLPAGYNMDYAYEDVRYTNWNKIPVLMPALKKVMTWVIGKERTDSFSFRNLVLRKFNFLFNITLIIYLILLAVTVRGFIRQGRQAGAMSPEMLFPKNTGTAKRRVSNSMA